MKALMYAVESENIDYVRSLIELGASVNGIIDKDGSTPLHLAVKKNNVEIVKLLLERGAMVHKKDFYKMTALQYASELAQYKIAKILIDHMNLVPYNRSLMIAYATQQLTTAYNT